MRSIKKHTCLIFLIVLSAGRVGGDSRTACQNGVNATYTTCTAAADVTADAARTTADGHYANCISPTPTAANVTTEGHCYYEYFNSTCPSGDTTCTSLSACDATFLGSGGVCNSVLQTEYGLAEALRKSLKATCGTNSATQANDCLINNPTLGTCSGDSDCQPPNYDPPYDQGSSCSGGGCVNPNDDGDSGCEGLDGDGTNGAACSSDDDCGSGLNCDQDTCTCGGGTDPVLIDVSGAGYLLTNLQHGERFDILADGRPKQLAWSSAASGVGFLALDRNGNGKIDSGAELFTARSPELAEAETLLNSGVSGTGKRRPASATPKNGLGALAAYDRPANGGNGDGQIDARDAVFSKLLIWVDKNHDGISQPDELFTLAQLGITSISLNIQPAKWSDAYGNTFTARAAVIRDGVSQWAYDVVLVTAK